MSAYEIRNFAVRCINLKAIKPGKEIVVKYDTNFFGNFNENCSCKFTFLHADPLKDQLPKKKCTLKFSKEAEKENEAPIGKAKKLLYRKQNFVSELKHRFKANVIVAENESSGDSSGDEISFLSYNDLHGSLELSKEVHATTNDSFESHITFSPNTSSIGLPVCSTPLRDAPLALKMLERLDEYEESEIRDRFFYCNFYLELDEIEVFDGSDFSTRDFHKNFKELVIKHTLSGKAQKDLSKFFCKILPGPNNVFTTMPIDQLPSTTKFTDQESTFVSVRFLPQKKFSHVTFHTLKIRGVQIAP